MNHDTLHEAVSALENDLELIKRLMQNLPTVNNIQDEILNVDQVAAFLNLKRQTIYQMVSARRIPFLKKKGMKRLAFSKNDLVERFVE